MEVKISRKYSSEILLNKKITNEEIAIYVSLALQVSNAAEHVYCSPEISYDVLGLSIDCVAKHQSVLKLIKKLASEESVNIRPLTKSIYVADASQFTNVQGNFVVDNVENVKKILKYIPGSERFSVLRYWLQLLTTIYGTTKYGTASLYEQSQLFDMAQNTILKRIKVLENLKILYVYRSNKRTINAETGKIVNMRNVYGRYEDKDIIESVGRQFEEEHGIDTISPAVKSKSRSYSMKYKHWMKGKKYSLEELEDIYMNMCERNEACRNSDNEYHVYDLSDLKAEIQILKDGVTKTA